MTDKNQMTEQEQNEWIKNQYHVATKYLADKGMVTNSVVIEGSRYLVPLVAVWKLKLINNESFWVICGDLPTDHINADVAIDAREALRHFSLKWQLQAENLLKQPSKEQQDFANLLISRADGLYDLHNNETLWQDNS